MPRSKRRNIRNEQETLDLQTTITDRLMSEVDCTPLFRDRSRSSGNKGTSFDVATTAELSRMRKRMREAEFESESDSEQSDSEADWQYNTLNTDSESESDQSSEEITDQRCSVAFEESDSESDSESSEDKRKPRVPCAKHPGSSVRFSRTTAEKQAHWQSAYDECDQQLMADFIAKPVKLVSVEEYTKPKIPDSEYFSNHLHPYFAAYGKFHAAPPKPATNRLVAELRRLWGRKGTIDKYPTLSSVKCKFCQRKTHVRKHCECRPLFDDQIRKNSKLYEFVKFIKKYYKENGRQIWIQSFGSPENCAAQLPSVWKRIEQTAETMRKAWNKPIPIHREALRRYPWIGAADTALFYKYAVGWPRNLLIMEVIGSRSRWFRQPDRLQFPNAECTKSEIAAAAIERDIEAGLRRGVYIPIPARCAELIIPLSYVEKTDTKKERVVISGEYPNFHEPKYKYKMTNIHCFGQWLEKNDRLAKSDFAKAFTS